MSFAIMVPPILHADRRNRAKPVMLCAIALLACVQLMLGALGNGLAVLGVFLLAFFVAFNVLEALIPSLVTRIAPAQARGTAIGVYNTTQTLGLFFGGLGGGWLATHWGAHTVFAVCGILSLVWLGLAAGMRPVRPVAVNPEPAFALGEKPRT